MPKANDTDHPEPTQDPENSHSTSSDPAIDSSEVATTKAQPFRLLDLPRELRDQIYQHSLVTNGYIEHPAKYKFQSIPELGVNLLRTSRQIHDEASQVLYGYNTFQIRPSDTNKGSPGVQWLDQFGARDCANIKNIELVTYNLARFPYAQLEKLCKSLTNLIRIVVVVLWKIIDDSAADWLRINCLLQNKPTNAALVWDDRDRKSVKSVLNRAFPEGYQHVDSYFTEMEDEEYWWERIPKLVDDYENSNNHGLDDHSETWSTDSEDDEDRRSESIDSAAEEAIEWWENGGSSDTGVHF
ncbi:MAG: hypothetical protein M1812_002362 [Candelaria pacifica]|nr:MAG: hypothetical protein M1812_002362 [Candelaria pacifica]